MKYEGIIQSVTRRQNSVNGNPRWTVVFADGRVMHTAVDAAVGYTIDNSEYQGTLVIVTMSNGEIVGIDLP